MDELRNTLEGLGTAGLVGLGVLLVSQLTLMFAAFVSLARRPASSVRGPKWVWVLVILLGELVGPILYFALARLPEQVDIAPADASVPPDRAQSVADVLYGGTTDGDGS